MSLLAGPKMAAIVRLRIANQRFATKQTETRTFFRSQYYYSSNGWRDRLLELSQRTSRQALESARSWPTRASHWLSEHRQRTLQSLRTNSRASLQNLQTNLRQRAQDVRDSTRSRVASSILSIWNGLTLRLSSMWRAWVVAPGTRIWNELLPNTWNRFWWWSLSALAVYGIATTVPKEVVRHYLRDDDREEESLSTNSAPRL